jgi:hypothetical protein
MEGHVPKTIKRSPADLRASADAYLTNGRYDPRKSAMIAEEYRKKRLSIEDRRAVRAKETVTLFNNVSELIKTKVRY